MKLSKVDFFFLGMASMFLISLIGGAIAIKKSEECEKRHLSTDVVMEWQSPDENTYMIQAYTMIPIRLADSFKLVMRDSSYAFSKGTDLGHAGKINYHYGTGLDSVRLKD